MKRNFNTISEEINFARKNILKSFYNSSHIEKWKWQKWFLWDDSNFLKNSKLNSNYLRKNLIKYFEGTNQKLPSQLSRNIENKLRPNSKILVIGSAGGDYLWQFGVKIFEKYSKNKARIYGIDINKELLQTSKKKQYLFRNLYFNNHYFSEITRALNLSTITKEKTPYRRGPIIYLCPPKFLRYSSHSINLINGDLLKLPFKNDSIDLVFADNTLYWLSNLSEALGEINRVLKLNGYFIFHKELTSIDDYYPISLKKNSFIMSFEQILLRYGFFPEVICDFSEKSGNDILIDYLNSKGILKKSFQNIKLNKIVSKTNVNNIRYSRHKIDFINMLDEGIFLITKKIKKYTKLKEYIFQTVCNPKYFEFLLGSLVWTNNKYNVAFVNQNAEFFYPTKLRYDKLFLDKMRTYEFLGNM